MRTNCSHFYVILDVVLGASQVSIRIYRPLQAMSRAAYPSSYAPLFLSGYFYSLSSTSHSTHYIWTKNKRYEQRHVILNFCAFCLFLSKATGWKDEGIHCFTFSSCLVDFQLSHIVLFSILLCSTVLAYNGEWGQVGDTPKRFSISSYFFAYCYKLVNFWSINELLR